MSTPELSILVSVYHGEQYLPAFFENVLAQTCFLRAEVILVLNEPSSRENKLAAEFKDRFVNQVRVLPVTPRESLGASWNRAWGQAAAPLLAIWNIDDRRPPDALERQLAAMRQEQWVLCYGDYVRVSHYGQTQGEVRTVSPYSAGHFARSFAQGGAFWMLRRELGEQAGYFDEQLQVAADMDMSLRLANLKLPMGKVDGIVGYFTDAAAGLSTRDEGRQSLLERTVVQLRYGVFDKVDPQLRPAAQTYRLDTIRALGEWVPLASLLPEYESLLRSRRWLWVLGSLRFGLRATLARLGLLNALHRLQARWLRKEL